MADTIQLKRGTSSQWESQNPYLEDGQEGWDKTIRRMKIGPGYWNDLSYINGVVENVGFAEIKTDRDFEESAGSWRPIYAKTIDIGALPNATTKNVAHNVSNISTWVKLSGVSTDASKNCRPLPYVTSTLATMIQLRADNANIIIQTSFDWSAYSGSVTGEYTKTTDTATSSPRYT